MDTFDFLGRAVEARFNEICSGGAELYATDAQELFKVYLDAFPEGTNPIFRTRTEHDCTCCRHFVKNIGHLVAIKDGELQTVWDISAHALPYPYDVVAAKMHAYVLSRKIVSVFRTSERRYGKPFTMELGGDNATRRWSHFSCDVPRQYQSLTPAAVSGEITTNVGVFRRGLTELTRDSIDLVLDLISENVLYRGAEYLTNLKIFNGLRIAYDSLPADPVVRDAFVWSNINSRGALIRNTAIGTLLVNLTEGMDLDAAVRAWDKMVDPSNFNRSSAPITQRMVDAAVADIKALGYESSLQRRFARIDDVSVNDVLFVDRSVRGKMRDGLAGLLADQVVRAPVDIRTPEPISITDFMSRVVPVAESIDLLVENRHLGNFAALTAPVDPDAPLMFRWHNGFAWSYDGDVTDAIKQRVKNAGGKVDADLRVSLAWSNADDLDLHVISPSGRRTFYGARGRENNTGEPWLDVDMNAFQIVTDPVENITWTGRIMDGRHIVEINQYNKRDSVNVGFTLQVAYDGNTLEYRHNAALRNKDAVSALTIIVAGGRVVAVEPHSSLVGGSISTAKWGVSTRSLVKVNTILMSPNFWGGRENGNLHWFFILDGCASPDPVRGIYNEFLSADILKHRKVLEVLGGKTKCQPTSDQLAGLGFSSTRADTVTVAVKGARYNRAFQITF